jgi:hypothetical protein
MSNQRYPYANQLFEQAGINLLTDTIMMCLVDLTKYTYSASHQFLSDLIGSSDPRIGTDQQLTGTTDTGGVFNANSPVTWSNVTGNAAGAVGIYKWTGEASTSPLIGYIGTIASGAINIVPNGLDIVVNFDSGQYKIFSL